MTNYGPTTIDEMITFDYSTLFEKDHFFSYFTHPAVPFGAVVLYLLLSNVVFSSIRSIFNLQPKGPVVQSITIIHSFILAVYSGWTFYNSFGIVYNHFQEHGIINSMCDFDNSLWTKIGWWVTHFYISKFYEFIDTWIILLKGRNPMFLQTYHHAGIVILLWGLVVTANPCGFVMLVLNSFIHTIMYTYYTFAAIGYSSPLKHYLTQAQLLQFIFGIAITFPLHFREKCISQSQKFVLAGVHAYVGVLIVLFGIFYIESYTKKGKDSKKA